MSLISEFLCHKTEKKLNEEKKKNQNEQCIYKTNENEQQKTNVTELCFFFNKRIQENGGHIAVAQTMMLDYAV